ncbi:hypothetical protein Ciccas_009871, partial [Cichlidogyrus casuarinus]
MSHESLPQRMVDLRHAVSEHQADRENIDTVVNSVKKVARHIGIQVGANPVDDAEGSGLRFVESDKEARRDSSMGTRIRSELLLQLSGLDTRWSAWDRAWSHHKILLKKRENTLSKLATID